MVSVAVAVSDWNVRAPAFVDVARAVADAAGVEFSDATVHVVAHAVSIDVGIAIPVAHAEGVELVSIAIAIPDRNVGAPAFVDLTWSVADAAGVERSHAAVHVVTHPIAIHVCCAIPAAHAKGVKLVPVAIAESWNQVVAPAFIDLARSVANIACVERPDTIVHIVANAIVVFVGIAWTTTHAEGIQLVSVAVAIPLWNVSAPTFVDLARSVADAAAVKSSHTRVYIVAHAIAIHVCVTRASTDPQRIGLVAVAIAVAFRLVVATAFEDEARAVADSTRVERPHTSVHVVTNPISIEVLGAIAATLADGIGLVPVTIAIAHRDNGASTRVNGARSVANAARIQGANARVFVVADSVKVHVEVAPASAHPYGVLFAAEAIAFAFLDAVAPTLVHRTRTVAHPARVQGSNAVVVHIANAVVVHVSRAIAPTFAKHVLHIAFAVAFAIWNFVTSAVEHGTRAIAFATFVQFAYALVDVVTDAVAVFVGLA